MRVLLITGGRHLFYETTPVITRFLRSAGHTVRVSRRGNELLRPSLGNYSSIVLNTCRGGVDDGVYRIPRTERDNDFTQQQRLAFKSYVEDGGGLISLHVAPTSCPGWPEMRHICGGGWVWGKSWHPPFCRFRVNVTDLQNPVARGVRDFYTEDEIYCDLDVPADVKVFLAAEYDGIQRPMGWTWAYGNGRVVNLSLGHAAISCENHSFQRLVLNAVSYVTSE